MWKFKNTCCLALLLVLAVLLPSISSADEEFSKQYKIEQLRQAAKLLKVTAFFEGVAGGVLVYLGTLASDIKDDKSATLYYVSGGVGFVGAYYTWQVASSDEKEADRMERELLEKKKEGLLHLENGKLAFRFPQVMMYCVNDRNDRGKKSVRTKVALFTCNF